MTSTSSPSCTTFFGIDVLVGPVHLGDVHQPFDAGLDLDERAVVGDVGDLAEQPRALRIAATEPDPRVLAELLHAQRYAVLFLVELQDLGRQLLADLHDFARMTHATPGEVGDVQQAVDAAQIDERAVVGDVLDRALDDRAFLEVLEQLGALFAHAGLDHRTAGDHDVVALAVELDDLELERLALEGRGVLDRPRVHQRTRQERADAVGHDREAALDFAGDGATDQLTAVERLLEVHPGRKTLGFVARQDGVAIAVLERFDRDRNEVARIDVQLTVVVLEFLERDVGLGLQAGVDDHEVVVDADHLGGDHFALLHLLTIQAFFEEGGKTFGLAGGAAVGCDG